jgi:hypothetical protein
MNEADNLQPQGNLEHPDRRRMITTLATRIDERWDKWMDVVRGEARAIETYFKLQEDLSSMC